MAPLNTPLGPAHHARGVATAGRKQAAPDAELEGGAKGASKLCKKLCKVTVLYNNFGLFLRKKSLLIDVLAPPHLQKTHGLPKIWKCWTKMAPPLLKIIRMKIEFCF